MGGTWERLVNVNASGSSAEITTGDFTTGKTSLRAIIYVRNPDAGNYYVRFNGDNSGGSSGNYNTTRTDNGTNRSSLQQDKLYLTSATSVYSCYMVLDITNVTDKEKLIIGYTIEDGGTTGTGFNPPTRTLISGKWANTSDSIKSIQVSTNSGADNFVTDSFITVYGASSDTVTDERPSNVPANSRFEATNLRKIYRRVVSSSIGTTKAGATTNSNSNITYITYKQITGLTSGDIITAVTFDAYSYSSTAFKGGVYTDSSNQPSSLLGSGTLASGSLSNTYTTVSITLDSPVTVPSNGIVWVAIVPSTNSPNLRVTTEGSSAYTHSVYATGSTPSGSYTNYANMLYSTANISGNGTANVRFGVTTGSVWKERNTA